MSAPPLPQRVSVRKAVTRNAHYEGSLGAAEMPRFRDVLGDGKGVRLSVDFGRDEQDRQIADVAIEAAVELECQRCLQRFRHPLSASSRLALVLTDEQAQALPRELEPWIAQDEIDLWELASEELALALPAVAYHPGGHCSPPEHDRGPIAVEEPAREKPFDVLSSLLAGGDAKEKE
jgi:uncharacterized protein